MVKGIVMFFISRIGSLLSAMFPPKKGERKERNMGASSSGQVITPKKGKSLFEIQSRSVFQIEISYEFTETKMYMQFQEQYDGTGGDERFST